MAFEIVETMEKYVSFKLNLRVKRVKTSRKRFAKIFKSVTFLVVALI